MRKSTILFYALTLSVGAFAQQAKEDFKKFLECGLKHYKNHKK